MWVELLIILLLTLTNGIFAGAELAIISIRKTRLHELVEEGSPSALAVKALRDKPERFLATVQIGITVIGATAGAFGGASLAKHLVEPLESLGLGRGTSEQLSFVLVVVLISYLSLVLGELVPKSLALKYSERYGLFIARPLRGVAWLGRPLVWLLTVSSNIVLKLFGDTTSFTESRISPDELQQLVEEASRAGTLHPEAGEIASRAFDLHHILVGQVMIPRGKIVGLPHDADAEKVKQILLEQPHSRLPVYEGRLDNIVGYVIAKDLLALYWDEQATVVSSAMRPVFFIPETKRAVDALKEMQRRRLQLAIVVDETGGVEGLVTTEDLVEELVGEIFSEDEQPLEMLRWEDDRSVLLEGTMPIREVNRALEIDLPEGDGFTTMAGLALFLAGRIPEVGATLETKEGATLEIVDASQRRVRKVRLRMPEEQTEDDEEDEGEDKRKEKGEDAPG